MIRQQGRRRSGSGGGWRYLGREGADVDKGEPQNRQYVNCYYYPPSSPPLVSAAAAAFSDSDPSITFGFGGEEAVATADGYTETAFAGFTWVYLGDHHWDRMGEVREEKVREGRSKDIEEE